MDARELSQRLTALQKMLNDKEPPAGIITVLETLKKEVVPTEELLRVGSFMCCESLHLERMRTPVLPIAANTSRDND